MKEIPTASTDTPSMAVLTAPAMICISSNLNTESGEILSVIRLTLTN